MEKTLHSKAYGPVVEILRAVRKGSGATVRELARRLRRDRNLIWRVENRERRIDILEFYDFCIACGADPVREAADLMRRIKRAKRSR